MVLALAKTGGAPSKWKGKKANFLGDSITQGLYTNGTLSTNQQYHYWLGQYLGLSTVRNYGVSGTHISGAYTSDGSSDPTKSFTARYSSMDNDADLIVVFGGTNDYGHSTTAPFGTIADTTDISFYGALHVLCEGLISKYLGKTIIFMTPLHRDNDTNTNSLTGKKLQDYVNAENEVCASYGIPVINLFAESGFSPKVPTFKSTYMDDGLHPNPSGHQLLASRTYKRFELN